jgi:lactate dehydrogenase-like 2-hydroxyacid dehydrogenase
MGAVRRVLTLNVHGLPTLLREQGYTPVSWSWPTSPEEASAVVDLAPEIEAVITAGPRPLPAGFLERADKLGLIACIGAGYDFYDPAALRERGVALVNAAGANAEDVAELTIGLLIAAQRRIVEADRWVRDGAWRMVSSHRMKGQKLGVLGLGAIGLAVAERAAAFGMNVGWSGPRPKDSPYAYFAEPLDLARWSDSLVVACRPTPDNQNLVDAPFLDALGPKGILVNVSRGSLVDEAALVAALREGRIAAAALDVYVKEPTPAEAWRDVPNLILHPHSGGATHEALADGCARAVENVRRYFSGEELLSRVN